ncbi:MAG: helix-turn-helix domain-containing protein [Stackebrandtia sp.]
MPQNARPTLARLALGDMLRRAREAAGLNPSQAADMIAYHRNTIVRIEGGEQGTKPLVVEKLCELYRTPTEQMSVMTRLALEGKERGWWEGYIDGPSKHAVVLETEVEASLIRTWDPEHIPGLLQTPDYLQAVQANLPYLDAKMATAVRDLRLKRQELVWGRRDKFEVQMIIGAAAILYLKKMPSRVVAMQIERLRRFAARPNVDIRIVDRVHAAMDGGFSILTPGRLSRPPFAVVTSLDGIRYIEESAVVSRYEMAFANSRKAAGSLEEYLR